MKGNKVCFKLEEMEDEHCTNIFILVGAGVTILVVLACVIAPCTRRSTRQDAPEESPLSTSPMANLNLDPSDQTYDYLNNYGTAANNDTSWRDESMYTFTPK